MKKLFALLLSGLSVSGFSQTLEIGGRGGIDSFWLLNSDKAKPGYSENYTLSMSYNGGLHLAYDITDNIGIETNLMYASLSQSYSGNFSQTGVLTDGNLYLKGETFTSKTTLTATQIPLLACLETNSGSFVELGAEYDMIQSANYTGSFSNPSANSNYSVTNYFSRSNISGVFGVGGKYSINDYVFILTDFRLIYGFTDVKGVDGSGQAYNPTNTITGSFNIGIFYLLSLTPDYSVGHKCKGSPKVRSTRKHN